jgi:hypothetical protein
MELLLRVSGPGHPPTDLRIDADHDQPVAVLATALAEHLELIPTAAPRLVIGRTGEFLDPDQAVGDCGIVSGDEVVVDPDLVAPPPPPTPLRAISLDVLAGHDSGSAGPTRCCRCSTSWRRSVTRCRDGCPAS